MKKNLTAALAVGLLAGSAAASSFSSSGRGTTAAEFLQLGVGGRAMGMAGAHSAAADGADALYWNPAALVRIERRAATFMHAAYLSSSYYDYLAYGQKLGKAGAVGASLQYLNAGAITQTDANYNSVGSFTPYDLALTAGYARRLDDLRLPGFSLGGAVKYIQSKMVNTAQTAAVDFGVLSPAYVDKKLNLAFTVANLGGTIKHEQTAENLPLTFRVGSSFKITQRWIAALDVAAPRDDDPYTALGTEYLLPIKDSWTFAGRLGFNSQTMGDVSGVSGLAMGAGLAAKSLSFDYAFMPYGGLGVSNRFSLAVKF